MYQGFLLKVGNTEIPRRFMKIDSFDVSYPALDLDAQRTADSNLHRNVIGRKLKVEFTTPYLYSNEMDELWSIINANILTELEQDANITCYYKKINDYVTQRCYLVDPEFKVAQNSVLGDIYSPMRICFIAY